MLQYLEGWKSHMFNQPHNKPRGPSIFLKIEFQPFASRFGQHNNICSCHCYIYGRPNYIV